MVWNCNIPDVISPLLIISEEINHRSQRALLTCLVRTKATFIDIYMVSSTRDNPPHQVTLAEVTFIELVSFQNSTNRLH